METYQTFKNEWNGRRVDYDHVDGYQCVDLILAFMHQCGGVGSGISGNAIDYANKPSPAFVNATVKVTDGSKQAGDIIVLGVTSSNPFGHITLRDTNLDEMLEQNGFDGNGSGLGRDAIGVYRAIPYDRVVAVYRLKNFIAAPAPAASVPEGSYTVIKAIPGYGDANNAANHINPVDTVAPGNYHIFNQADGMVNITSNPNAPGSWINPSDNTAPVVTPPPPPPVVAPPVAPLPAAPLRPSGNSNNTYAVIKTIPGYTTATQAGNHINPVSKVAEGTYYVYNTYPNNGNLINVTKILGTPGAWINKADNVLTPIPAAEPAVVAAPVDTSWQSTYRPFPSAVHYIATRDLTVKDLSGQAPDGSLPEYEPGASPPVGVVSAYGTVVFEYVSYYRLKTNNDPKFEYWYCIPKMDAETNTPNLLVMPTTPLTPPSKAGTARDTLELAKARFEEDLPKFIDILPKWFKNKK
jgi:hypothetical protein